ncbi:MAG TPA: hypothetical protein VNJ12_04410, partial [Candidatus Dormibacteraeota bacterium]|nr:hypothetical protein [Candidatus Dormibacteraeota bacterium]
LAAAKGWAEAFSKPAIGVSVLEAVAAQATTPAPLLASVVDARRGQLYGALYERRNGQIVRCGDEMVLTPEELFAWLAERPGGKSMALVSPAPETFQAALARSPLCDASVERVSPFLAAMIGLLAYRRAVGGEAHDAIGLDANYVRRSDAEVKWKD